jgi:hypothetical protein
VLDTWSYEAVRRPSWRDACRRNMHIMLAVVAGLAGTAALLLWGPIGIGNGPLTGGAGGAEFGGVGGMAPLALFVPLGNSGPDAAVIDSIGMTGHDAYPAPHLVAAEAMDSAEYTDCPDLAAVRFRPGGFAVGEGCTGQPAGLLAGRPVGSGADPMAVLAVRAPAPGSCWLLTDVIVHYHVGDRYYTGTYPDVVADCGPRGAWPAEEIASRIADHASG